MSDDIPDGPPQKVGRGRPPKSGQIKPGEVRNPKGRPKKSANFIKDRDETLELPASYTGKDGVSRDITSQKAAFLRLRENALKPGNDRALERFLDYGQARYEDEQAAAALAERRELYEREAELLRAALPRLMLKLGVDFS